jgi:Domain of unknown function (DUF4105)
MPLIRGVVARAVSGAALLLLLSSGRADTLHAQRGIDWSTKPVLLLTMGQGSEVFEKFGHNAIVVWDDAAGMPLVYNWGLFDFDQPNFIGRFLSGDTKYWMAPATMAQTMRQYEYLNRTVVAQELQLTPEQKTQLTAALATNALEANKYYRYDYYRDNCSTRARDAIGAVTNGAVKRAMLAQPGQGSYRWHTRRLLGYSAPLYYGIQLVLGIDADAPLTGWQEAFLPQSLHESLTRIELPASGAMAARPIVGSTDTLFRAVRDAEPPSASSHLVQAAIIGVVLAAILLGLAKLGRFGVAVAIGGWSLLSALLGCALLLAWFATQHVFMRNNPTVALLNPGWFVGLAAAVAAARGGVSPGLRSALRWLLVIGVVGAAGAVLLGHPGSALELSALLLPGHAAVVWAADQRRSRGQRS